LRYITVQRREMTLISPEADDLDRASTTMVSIVPTKKKKCRAFTAQVADTHEHGRGINL